MKWGEFKAWETINWGPSYLWVSMLLSSFSGLHLFHLAHPHYSSLSQRSNVSVNPWEVLSTQHVSVTKSLQIHIQEIFRAKKWGKKKRKATFYVITDSITFTVSAFDFCKLPKYLKQKQKCVIKAIHFKLITKPIKEESQGFLEVLKLSCTMGIKHIMSASAQGSKSQRMVKIQEVLILGSLGSLS